MLIEINEYEQRLAIDNQRCSKSKLVTHPSFLDLQMTIQISNYNFFCGNLSRNWKVRGDELS